MKILPLLICLLAILGLKAQDTVYIDQNGTPHQSLTSAYHPIDTTYQIYDSTFHSFVQIGSPNGHYSNTDTFLVPNNYKEYFVSFDFKTVPNTYFHNLNIDTNSVSYYNNSISPPLTQTVTTFYQDSIVLDSVSQIIATHQSGGKNHGGIAHIIIYHQITTIHIDQTVSLHLIDSKDNEVNIFPNPANETLHVASLYLNNTNEAFIYDVKGRLVKKFQINQNKIQIASLDKGIYFIRIPDLKLNRKFIKE